MGALSDFCCRDLESKASLYEPYPFHKQRLRKPTANEDTSEPPSPSDDDSNEETPECRNSEDLLSRLEQIYRPTNANTKLTWESFKVAYKIGHGGFGDVFLGELKENAERGVFQPFAIKRIPKEQVLAQHMTSAIQLEKRILHESKSPFITKLYYAFRDSRYLYLVM